MTLIARLFLAALPSLALASTPAQPGNPPESPLARQNILQDALAIQSVFRAGRTPVVIDAIQNQIATGTWKPPVAGDTIMTEGGSAPVWAGATSDESGWIKAERFRSGYVFARVKSESARLMILNAQGHGMVYVNGEPRAGDPYRFGNLRLPVALRAGDNEFLFQAGRSDLAASLEEVRAQQQFDLSDVTTPDLIAGEMLDGWIGVTIINNEPSPTPRESGRAPILRATLNDAVVARQSLDPIAPSTARKIALRINAIPPLGEAAATLKLTLTAADGSREIDAADLQLRVRQPHQTFKRTFISEVDGSVQYYAVVPARPRPGDPPPALVLSLHGASVEATSQADAYSPKTWATIICATNRRPFGFDWEDWGRLDALEVLADAKKTFQHDPSRVYLTGHSMGGHGTWNLSTLRPDLFAAIGPSAGWESFTSYGAPRPKDPKPVEAMLYRAAATSDTLKQIRNLAPLGVYILHGDADDNVPVTQARTMRDELAKFHRDFAWHEQPGAGHWWENSDEPGAECLDWPAMFDLFSRRRIATNAETREVEFSTVNPGVSSSMKWLTIEAQEKALESSRAVVRFDPGLRRFTGTTENTRRLSLDVAHLAPGRSVIVQLDGKSPGEVGWPAGGRIYLERTDNSWQAVPPPPPSLKGPFRSGPFKAAFNHRVVLVYPTSGTRQENAWGYAKARYDAETFSYRGNASLELVADRDFDAASLPDRSVIIYGNSACNSQWGRFFADSPIVVSRSEIKVADRVITGDDLACLFVRPRPGSDVALVGAVAGTGLAGLHVTDRLPVFLSGVQYPDWTLISAAMLREGADGFVGAGFFADDWSVAPADSVWR